MLFLPIKYSKKLHRAFARHLIFKNLRKEGGSYTLSLRVGGIIYQYLRHIYRNKILATLEDKCKNHTPQTHSDLLMFKFMIMFTLCFNYDRQISGVADILKMWRQYCLNLGPYFGNTRCLAVYTAHDAYWK
jgi:hypothetical protein